MVYRVLMALFWIGFACVAWAFKDSFKPASDQHIAIGFAIVGCFVVPPFIAIGTLFGRARLAALIGLTCFAALVAWILFVISLVGI